MLWFPESEGKNSTHSSPRGSCRVSPGRWFTNSEVKGGGDIGGGGGGGDGECLEEHKALAQSPFINTGNERLEVVAEQITCVSAVMSGERESQASV